MIKSQDVLNPCNDGHRSSEVLVATVEKCERLQKQLDIAVSWLESISTLACCFDEDLKEQIKMVYRWSSEALEEIKELEKWI